MMYRRPPLQPRQVAPSRRHGFILAVFVVGLMPILGSSPAALAAPPARAKETPKLRQIRTLLALTGAERLGRQIAVQMIARIRGAFPKVPEAFWRQMIVELDVKALVGEIAHVYDRHLTSKDVAGLLTFYRSPLGRRFVKLQPKLLTESVALGQRWARQLSGRIVAKMKTKGYVRGQPKGGKSAPKK